MAQSTDHSIAPSERSGRKVINSVQRAVDILGLFEHHGRELGTTEIAELLGLHKSTAAGLMYTLERNGFLAQNPATRKYHLGFRLVELGSLVLGQLDIRQAARPHMEHLGRTVGETVNLGIRDGTDVVYIERVAGSHSLGMRREIGSRTPLHASALGKVLLAWLPPTERNRLLDRLTFTARTPHTLVSRDDFERDLAATRERGFAIDDEENEIGGRCVAAPILDHRGQVVAALSVSSPVSRTPAESLPERGGQVGEAARAISRQIGGD
jgi:IclR family KDG regulon transcriptional repressor